MNLIDQILRSPEVVADPPILVDVGASGGFFRRWRSFASHAICVAFDPDSREMSHAIEGGGGYKKLHVVKAIVSDQDADAIPFYLTVSPYCSSALKTNVIGLKPWLLSDWFGPAKTVTYSSCTLKTALEDLKLNRVDWLKIDAQGLDLRVWRGLSPKFQESVIAVDFEPGLIDAYIDEDKVEDVLSEMKSRPFWLYEFAVNGMPRVPFEVRKELIDRWGFDSLNRVLKKAPGWMDVGYFHNFENHRSKRDFLVGLAFSLTLDHLGFSYFLASKGGQLYGDEVFEAAKQEILARVNSPVSKLKRRIQALGRRVFA